MKVNREKYFDVLDFINEVNGKDLWDLDLSFYYTLGNLFPFN